MPDTAEQVVGCLLNVDHRKSPVPLAEVVLPSLA